MKNASDICIAVVCVGLWALGLTGVGHAETSVYVGSKACLECHKVQYETFTKYAKKAKSHRSVQLMAPKLTAEEVKECYGCHTTGYQKPGGFISFTETPELGHAGCEVCHGPGSEHIKAGGDPSLIKKVNSLKDCEGCHSPDRVKSFNFKPLLHGGAH